MPGDDPAHLCRVDRPNHCSDQLAGTSDELLVCRRVARPTRRLDSRQDLQLLHTRVSTGD
jgi:hypothetical protein